MKFEMSLPQNLKEAIESIQEGSCLKAGGMDLLDLMKEGILSPKRLVNLKHLAELHFVRQDEKGLALGPALTLRELWEEKLLQGGYQALAQAARGAATPQIQNVATLGGNLCQRPRCWYFRHHDFPCTRKGGNTCFALTGENQSHAIFGNGHGCVMVHPSATAVALLALHGKIKIAKKDQTREVEGEKFFIPPYQSKTKETILEDGEIITEILLPPLSKGLVSYYHKEQSKQSFDWPLAEVAVALEMDGSRCSKARIVLGSAAPIPWRLEEAEGMVENKTITKDLAKKVAQSAMKRATPLSQNGYKVNIFKTVLYRTLCRAVGIDPLK